MDNLEADRQVSHSVSIYDLKWVRRAAEFMVLTSASLRKLLCQPLISLY